MARQKYRYTDKLDKVDRQRDTESIVRKNI